MRDATAGLFDPGDQATGLDLPVRVGPTIGVTGLTGVVGDLGDLPELVVAGGRRVRDLSGGVLE